MIKKLYERDWVEDNNNGHIYLHMCPNCKVAFSGFKRRKLCKICFGAK